jgi:hypothetical protein
VVDPLVERGREAAAELMRRSAEQREKIQETLAAAEEAIRRENRDVAAMHHPTCSCRPGSPGVKSASGAPPDFQRGAWVSADVLTRPVQVFRCRSPRYWGPPRLRTTRSRFPVPSSASGRRF